MQTTTPRKNSELFSEKQVADFLGVSPGTLSVWRCVGRYQIPYIKIGAKVRYSRDSLEVQLASRTHGLHGDDTLRGTAGCCTGLQPC